MDDALKIPDFLCRSVQKENTMSKKDQPQDEEQENVSDKAEPRPTKAAFLEAANTIDEVDAQLDDLNAKRNEASEIVRKYLGRKR